MQYYCPTSYCNASIVRCIVTPQQHRSYLPKSYWHIYHRVIVIPRNISNIYHRVSFKPHHNIGHIYLRVSVMHHHNIGLVFFSFFSFLQIRKITLMHSYLKPNFKNFKLQEITSHYPDIKHIHTDGSKDGPKVAATCVSRTQRRKCRLLDNASIFSTESHPIYMALDYIYLKFSFSPIHYLYFSVRCFGVRVSVMFHFMFVHYTFSSV